MQSIVTKYPKNIVQDQHNEEHGYGSWASQIFMSSDFDDPMEELEEYM